jgi:hypothetical protein
MTHDEWRLLRYGMLTAFLMALVLVPILAHDRNFPKSVAEGILGAIAPKQNAVRGISKSNAKTQRPTCLGSSLDLA